ncbi:hypothetical protein [Streptomyces sp. NBC_01716]|uniref:hypothetical protein n=1 Tax=Streptomyces sp. NBC_01716 TaxID=2975917 RepID=UPI002E30F6DD|nr:hypothetical protein [Streptomyces sp. NBC_01716]
MRFSGQLEGAAVICPHCGKDARYRERGNGLCPVCKRAFALEPKENKLRLHDVRMRKLIHKLSNGGGLRYTPTQLYYAAARGRTPAESGMYGCVALGLLVLGAIASWVIISVSGFDRDVILGTLTVGGVYVVLVVVLSIRGAMRAKRTGRVEVPMPFSDFKTSVIDRWAAVYGKPPIGMAPEGNRLYPVLPAGEVPKLVLLCPDSTVLACLVLNGAPEKHSLALVQSVHQLARIPGDPSASGGAGPVGIVLHDASPAGLAFASEARAALGGRVVVAGMLPRTVKDNPNAVRLRSPLGPADLEAIRVSSSRLTAAEADWLTRGWWSPIAAVTPVKLLSVVARAVDRAEGIADPDRGRAQQVGFLTWPTAS